METLNKKFELYLILTAKDLNEIVSKINEIIESINTLEEEPTIEEQ